MLTITKQFILDRTLQPLFAVGLLAFQWRLFVPQWALPCMKKMGIILFPFLCILLTLSRSLHDCWFQSMDWKWFSSCMRIRPMLWCVLLFSCCILGLLREGLFVGEVIHCFPPLQVGEKLICYCLWNSVSFFSFLLQLWLYSILLFAVEGI